MTSFSKLKQQISGSPVHTPSYKTPISEEYYHKPNITSPQGRKANATFVILGETNVRSNEPLLINLYSP